MNKRPEQEPPRERQPAQVVAERCAAVMWEGDEASRSLGMTLEAVRPGYARISMPIRADMVNGHDNCHGGLIFTLADSAFAFACNGSNRLTVASGASIDFIAPGRRGDVLTATCQEQSRSGRTGVYDVRVENQDGRLVALFRGRSYTIAGSLVPGLEVEEP